MNDKDIIKALECCTKGGFVCDENCPRFDNGKLTISACRFELLGEALDLINRQKSEIERLKDFIEKDQGLILKLTGVPVSEYNQKIKAEAIKEFAERLKEKATVDDDSTWWVANIDIDNLVKEMTEGKE